VLQHRLPDVQLVGVDAVQQTQVLGRNLRKLHWCPSKSGRSLLALAQEERDLQLAHERLDSDTGTQFSSADVAAAAGLDRTHYPTAG